MPKIKQQTLINAASLIAAPFTGGVSLLGLAVPYVFGGDDDESSSKRLEEWKIQNDQWKTMMEANRAEIERLRKEREKNDNDIKHNNNEIERLRAIINNPHSSEGERENARKRIVILEDEIKNLKIRNKKIDGDIADKSKIPPAPSKPWSFPKLSLIDKTLIGGGVFLLIYLLIPNKKKE